MYKWAFLYTLLFLWNTYQLWFYGSASIHCDWAHCFYACSSLGMVVIHTHISAVYVYTYTIHIAVNGATCVGGICVCITVLCMKSIESRDQQIFEQLITVLTAASSSSNNNKTHHKYTTNEYLLCPHSHK